MKKKFTSIVVAIAMCLTLSMTVQAAPNFMSEWAGFTSTSQSSSNSDGLKSYRTRAIQLVLTTCTAYSVHQNISVDGSFGTNTHNAVVRYQNYYNLQANGVVGTNTWSSLFNRTWSRGHDGGVYGGYYLFYTTGYSGGEPGESEVLIIRSGDTTGRWQVRTAGVWSTFEYAN